MKDGGGEGSAFGFKLKVVNLGIDEDGEIVDSCVVEHCQALSKKARSKTLGDLEKIVMGAVLTLAGPDGKAPLERDVIGEAVKQIAHDPAKRDTRGDRVVRSMNGLIAKSLLERAEDGRVFPPGRSE
jgi:hypothetical protein